MGVCCKIPYRFWIGVMVFFSTYINYTTRSNQSLSITSMVKKTKARATPECKEGQNVTTSNRTIGQHGVVYDWDEATQGYIIASYFWGYFIGNLPSGVVAEWFGPFWTIFISTLLAAILNSASVPCAIIHWALLVTCRFFIGFFGAFVYPALHVLVARWSPPAEKGKFVSAFMGNTLGTCMTWYIVAEVTQSVNWYWGYHAITIENGIFLIIFWFIVTDYPDSCKWISKEEVEFIKTAQEGKVSKAKKVPPYLRMMLSIPFWAFTIAHTCNLWGLFLQLTGVPKFLVEVVGFKLRESGILGALPQLARLFFGLFFGFLGDFLVKSGHFSKTFVRKGFILCSHIIPGILLMLMWVTGCNPYAAVALLTVSMGFNGASVITHLQNTQELSPNFAGAIFGFANLLASTTGFICPILTSLLIKNHNGINEWGVNFVIGGIVYCVGGLFFIIFGSTSVQSWNEKIDKEPEATTAT